jgi:hypothetical protein
MMRGLGYYGEYRQAVTSGAGGEEAMGEERNDLYKLYPEEYSAPREPRLIRSLKTTFLTIPGHGDPPSPEFQARMRVLYSVAYAIRAAKKMAGQNFRLCRIEAIWWGTKEGAEFCEESKRRLNSKLLICMPYFVRDQDRLSAVLNGIKNSKAADLYETVELNSLPEGLCVQMLHVGARKDEATTITRMKEHAKSKGLDLHGALHEIYLSDPRRATLRESRIILRIPVVDRVRQAAGLTT